MLRLSFIEETRQMTPNSLFFVMLGEKEIWMMETAFGVD